MTNEVYLIPVRFVHQEVEETETRKKVISYARMGEGIDIFGPFSRDNLERHAEEKIPRYCGGDGFFVISAEILAVTEGGLVLLTLENRERTIKEIVGKRKEREREGRLPTSR